MQNVLVVDDEKTLLMIMTVCLMVYAALEYRIRQGLQQQGQTVLNQSGKPTDRPTARWIFHCFVGIHMLFQEGQCVGIVNLEERHWSIITLLGYQAYYMTIGDFENGRNLNRISIDFSFCSLHSLNK